MCGFAGVLTFDGQAKRHVDVVERLTELVSRRGPDDEGFWNDDHISLGFRRLAILDLTPSGHQPMESPDGRYVLVFNGEVYNHRDIRRELDGAGEAAFRSTSDSEVVLRALCAWGERALERFDGMFSLAFYDKRDRRLILARDPMGIKPLFYLDHPQGLVFGSQYDQLIAHPWCDRSEVRLDVLSLYLRFGYIPSPYGLLKRTFQVPAGHFLVVDQDSPPTLHSYWTLPVRHDRYLTTRELNERLDSALAGAIERQLVADVPVGTFLSGGIDSPLVTALAHRHRGGLPAFTIGSESPSMDESAAAADYAKEIGCGHVLEQIGGLDAKSLIGDYVSAYSEPFADFSALPTLLVSRLSRESVSVMLSGDGGDELFWGYPRMWTTMEWRRFHRLPRHARRLAHSALRGRSHRPPLGAAMFDSIGEWYAHKHGPVEMLELAPSLPSCPPDFALYDSDGISTRDELAQWLRRVEIEGHLEKMLIKVDRASMFHSLEVRVPLLDLELVELAMLADPRDCVAGGLGKLPLRHALSRFVPQGTISSEKRGFEVPMGNWLSRELRDTFEERVIEDPSFLPDIWDSGRIRDLFKKHVDGDVEATQPLWTLLSLQLWAERGGLV